MTINYIKPVSIEEIKARINKINEKINLPERSLPEYYSSTIGDHYYIKLTPLGYTYALSGHWNENDEKSYFTTDVDQLIFWAFRDATHRMAFEYEARNRIDGQDNRIIAFKKHIEILESLDLKKECIERLKLNYNDLLNQNLFVCRPEKAIQI